jgi:hypothetical protein
LLGAKVRIAQQLLVLRDEQHLIGGKRFPAVRADHSAEQGTGRLGVTDRRHRHSPDPSHRAISRRHTLMMVVINVISMGVVWINEADAL